MISGILAGDPWFPHSAVLLHSLDGMAMWFLCFCVLFCLGSATPIPELIQCYHLTLIISLWTGPPITFHFACFWGVLFGCFLFVCFWCGLAVCCFSAMDRDGCWTTYRSHHFCGPHTRWRLYVCINELIYRFYATCNWTCGTTSRKPRGVGRKKKVSSTGYHREGKQVESPNRRMIFFVRFEKDNIELKHNLNENSQTGV